MSDEAIAVSEPADAELTPEQLEQQQNLDAAAAAIRDNAFDRYVTPQNMQAASQLLDVDALIDCALQLAHGERILLRPHHSGLTPGDFLQFAANVAAEQRNQDAFGRITAAAQSAGANDLMPALEAAQKLAASARATSVDLGDHDWIAQAIAEAELLRDERELDELLQHLPDSLTDVQRAAVLREVEAAKTRITSAESNPILNKLVEPSRAFLPAYTFTIHPLATTSKKTVQLRISVGSWFHPVTVRLYSGSSWYNPDSRWKINWKKRNAQGRNFLINASAPEVSSHIGVKMTAMVYRSIWSHKTSIWVEVFP